MKLDESYVELYSIYAIVRNQVRVSAMGETIGLDFDAVLSVINLYVDSKEELKEAFEFVLKCFNIEREFVI